MSALFYGVDLGTGNCSVAYVADDPRQRDQLMIDVRTVGMRVSEDDDGTARSGRVPSIVAADWRGGHGGGSLFGWEFVRALDRKRRAPALLRRGVDYFTSVKSDMGTNRTYPRSAVAGADTPGQVTTLILRRLAEAVNDDNPRHHLESSHVTLTVPASFSTLARLETLEAARAAGLAAGRVELIDEPVAALIDLLNGSDASGVLDDEFRNILVFDYGAGTCDLSLVGARYNRDTINGLEVVNLAISPYRRLGGDDIDRAVMREIVWPQIANDEERARIPARERRLVEDTLTGTVARGLKERICRKVDGEVRRDGPDALAKSRAREVFALGTRFTVPALDRQTPAQFTIHAADFARVMQPFLADPFTSGPEPEASLLLPVVHTLKRAGLAPRDLDALVLHGGGSLNPYVRHMLEDRVGRRTRLFDDLRVVTTPDPLTSVARGAALAGYWRHARGVDVVRPIAADDLGIVVLGGAARRLVHAGQPLPFPDEDGVEEVTEDDDLVTPLDGQPELLVPVYTGRSDAPAVSGTVKVVVPPDTPAGTPVRIKLRISRDKTLDWWFAIGDAEFQKAGSVADPWTTKTPTAPERQLQEWRRQLRERVDRGETLPADALFWEAILVRLAARAAGPRAAEYLNEALEATENLVSDAPDTARFLNLKGLILSEQGKAADALAWFSAAAKLEPKNAVIAGNLGATLADVGRAAEARAFLRAALTLDANLTYVYDYLADLDRREGDEAGAMRELRRAEEVARRQIDRSPRDPDGWRQLAHVHWALGDYASADKARATAAELERNDFYGGDSAAIVASRFGRRTWQEQEDE